MPAAKHPKPLPIFDTLDETENPFHQHQFDVSEFFTEQPLAGAEIDLEYSAKFLFSYNGSKATFNSYRREVERLLQWAWLIRQVPAHQLKRQDIEDFVRFCQKPPTTWIGVKPVTRFQNNQGQRKAHPEWRPFMVSVSKVEAKLGKVARPQDYQMSQSAVKSLFAILSTYFNYLNQEDVCESNPVALIRQKSKFLTKSVQREVRRISNLQWDYLIETARLMAEDDPVTHERTLFIMNCLYGMYLRISELVADDRSTPLMQHFNRDGDGNWWFNVIGKGNKERSIAVSDQMLTALKRYRCFLGLTPLPTPGEMQPLLSKIHAREGIRSTSYVRALVQNCFDAAVERMVRDGLEQDSYELQAATVHWLRHTGISEDVKHRPVEHVRDDAGHASSLTTDRYIDAERRARHASAKNKAIKPE